MAKKRTPLKRSKPRKAPTSRLKKAVPPPDNPLLRQQSEEAGRNGESTTKEMARRRSKAWKQTQDMPTSDAPKAPPNRPGSDDDHND